MRTIGLMSVAHRPPPLIAAVAAIATVALIAPVVTSCSSGSSTADSVPTAPSASSAVPGTAGATSAISSAPASISAVDVTIAATSSTVAATTTTVPTAAAIAAEITAAERGIRDTTLSVAAVAELGRRQQRAYRLLARNPDLDGAVLALIPADVATAYAFNVAARQAVVDHAAGSPPSTPSPTLPAWTIVEPRPIDELLADYREAEALTGVSWTYLAAINLVETRMGRISGASSAGALGPMQFLPETWAACCTGDINDPHDAIIGAATYLAQQGAPADMHAALYGYNPNEGYVGAVTAYAANLAADPLAYRGYHAWEVYVGSVAGTVRLPIGYRADEPLDAATYVREHPEDVIG